MEKIFPPEELIQTILVTYKKIIALNSFPNKSKLFKTSQKLKVVTIHMHFM